MSALETFFKKYWNIIFLFIIVLLGILLRMKGLLINPSMWHDECALGVSIKFKNYCDLFGTLRFGQVAPPFFMIMAKLITKIFGFSDISLRILPFLAGVGSLIAFYPLAEKTLKNKAVVLWAVFFFAINLRLINYSFEFKSYEFDVLFAIICLLFFMNLDLKKLSIKKSVLYGILISIVPWFSLTSVFIIAGGWLNLLLKNIKADLTKKLVLIFPIIISSLIYLNIYLLRNYTGTNMVNYWQGSFLNSNPMLFLYLLIENIKYFFFPMQGVLFALILLIWGMCIFYKEKSEFINIAVISFILLVAASLLHFYPFANRLILFLVPIFLLLIVKPLDTASFGKKFELFIILFLAFFTFCPQIIHIDQFIKAQNISKGECAREMMDFMSKNIKKSDVIFINDMSNTEFAYYSSFYNIKNNVIQEPQKYNHIKSLSSIKKGSYCWFYLAYGDIKPFMIWIEKNAKIIQMVNSSKANNYLIYAYIK